MAEGARHPWIDLCHDDAGVFRGGERAIDGDAERTVAGGIGWGDVDECDIERQRATRFEEGGDLREEDGGVVGAALLDGGAGVGTDEQRVVAEAVLHARLRVRRGAIGVQVDDFDFAQVPPEFDKAGNEHVRRGGASMDVEAIARVHDADGFIE